MQSIKRMQTNIKQINSTVPVVQKKNANKQKQIYANKKQITAHVNANKEINKLMDKTHTDKQTNKQTTKSEPDERFKKTQANAQFQDFRERS